ncbi:hypothetical protein [Fictibacillus macauensis]|nr:hypothetical protein [Fictibacillus macauensis]
MRHCRFAPQLLSVILLAFIFVVQQIVAYSWAINFFRWITPNLNVPVLY